MAAPLGLRISGMAAAATPALGAAATGTLRLARNASKLRASAKRTASTGSVAAAAVRCFSSLPTVSAKPLATKKKVVVISGATGEVGKAITKESTKRNHTVIACSRNPGNKQSTELVTHQRTTEDQTTSPQSWLHILEPVADKADEVLFVNTIGGAVPPKGKTLSDINRAPVIAAAKASEYLAKCNPHKKVAFVHISTLAASVKRNTHPYSSIKEEVDQELMALCRYVSICVLRPGIIFNSIKPDGRIDMGHDYSPDQLAMLPFQPVFGSGLQMTQPVHAEDLATATVNASNLQSTGIINAVGPDKLSMVDMIRIFRDLKGKPTRPITIPYTLAHLLANYAPKGRFAPYSVSMFEQIDHGTSAIFSPTEFVQLLGKPPQSMHTAYMAKEGQKVMLSRPPLLAHSSEILGAFFSNPAMRADFLDLLLKPFKSSGS